MKLIDNVKYLSLVFSLVFFFNVKTNAQDDEFKKWLQEDTKKMNTFIEEDDKQFKEFLEKDWKAFQMSIGVNFDAKPKIVKPVVFSENPDKTDVEFEKKIEGKKEKGIDKSKTKTKEDNTKKKEGTKLNDKKPILSDSKNPFKDDENKLTDKKDKFTEGNKISDTEKELVASKEPIKSPEKITPKTMDEPKTVEVPKTEVKKEPIKEQDPDLLKKKQEVPEQIVKKTEPVETKTPEVTKEISNIPTETNIQTGTGVLAGIDLNKNDTKMDLTYYGSNLLFQYAKNIKVTFSGRVDNKAISKFWEEISSKNYKDLITQLNYYKKNMNLNDWAYVLLINDIAGKLYKNDRNSKHLFDWFILTKSGYRSKVGFIDNKIVLFMPTKTKIYGIPYFTSSDTKEKLYVIDFDNLTGSLEGSIYSYDGDYPDSKKLVDMNVYQAPKLESSEKERIINFKYKGVEYKVNVAYNFNTVKFYEYYPYSSLDVYFNYNVSEETKQSLIKSLTPLVEGKSEADAANILLRFVQIGFEYQTDDVQFNREKPLFLEETMNYRYCDCEDRSILYSFLVKTLLNLPVVGVDYPGHVATAVKFSVDVAGDYVTYKGQKYTVCDPTYINAYIGMAMPQFKNGKLEGIIEVKN